MWIIEVFVDKLAKYKKMTKKVENTYNRISNII